MHCHVVLRYSCQCHVAHHTDTQASDFLVSALWLTKSQVKSCKKPLNEAVPSLTNPFMFHVTTKLLHMSVFLQFVSVFPSSSIIQPNLTACSQLDLGYSLGCLHFSFVFEKLLWDSIFILKCVIVINYNNIVTNHRKDFIPWNLEVAWRTYNNSVPVWQRIKYTASSSERLLINAVFVNNCHYSENHTEPIHTLWRQNSFLSPLKPVVPYDSHHIQ
jgi:hypothetical protein